MLVDPTISSAKLDRQLDDWENNAELYRERGWILLDRDGLHVDVAFTARLPIGPVANLVAIPLAIRFCFENFDIWAPSVRVIDPSPANRSTCRESVPSTSAPCSGRRAAGSLRQRPPRDRARLPLQARHARVPLPLRALRRRLAALPRPGLRQHRPTLRLLWRPPCGPSPALNFVARREPPGGGPDEHRGRDSPGKPERAQSRRSLGRSARPAPPQIHRPVAAGDAGPYIGLRGPMNSPLPIDARRFHFPATRRSCVEIMRTKGATAQRFS